MDKTLNYLALARKGGRTRRSERLRHNAMTNSGFFQLFDRHEREDYNATLSEAAIRQMISEEFEEVDKIISAGFDKETLKTLDANGQLFIPTFIQ